jgi:septum site-determining protein MinD
LRTIAIVSGKGGVGKTTSAISLAHAMHLYTGKTLLVDANISTPNVHLYLGWPVLKKNFMSVLKEEASHGEAIYRHESGLRVLPTISTPADIRKMKKDRLAAVIKELDGSADVVLLDSAAGLGQETVEAINASDEVLVVTNPEIGAVVDAQKVIQLSHELGRTVLGVLLNKAGQDKYELSVSSVEKMLDSPVLGVIPFDRAVREAYAQKHPVTHSHPRSRAAQQYEEVAAMLLGRKYMQSILKRTSLKTKVLKKLGFA